MKHAYLIMAHKNWNQLMTLLTLLDDSRNEVFLHIDRFVSEVPWEQLQSSVKRANLVFVKRIGCLWADYSLVKAELTLLKEAVKTPHAYYHLISGQDLPLKTQDEIHDFFEKNAGSEFVEFWDIPPDGPHSLGNNLRYYTILRRTVAHVKQFGIVYYTLRCIQKLSLPLQKLFHVNRIQGKEGLLFYGSQWFSITDNFARYLLSQERYIKKQFRCSKFPDEHFLQSVMMHSLFRDKISQTQIRLINWKKGTLDWKNGHPSDYTAEDYIMLRSSKCLFARKFSETTDPEIISMIAKDLRVSG